MGVRKIRELVRDIDPEVGILDREGEYLYNLARRLPSNGCIVEIGSWKGRSTIWLGMGAKESGNLVYAIDPHSNTSTHNLENTQDTFEEFRYNIEKAGLSKIVIPLRMESYMAKERGLIKNCIRLIFIDGEHTYSAVLEDFLSWCRLPYSGIVVFHDTIGYEGPRKVVEEFLFCNRGYRIIGICGQLVAAKTGLTGLNFFWWVYWKAYSWLFLLATKLPRSWKERLK